MKSKQWFMVRGDADDDEFLDDNTDCAATHRPAKAKEITAEALADHMDRAAENCNAHDFVFSHRALAALLHNHLGRKKTTAILLELANHDGLHGMTGVAGSGDPEASAKALGVQLDDWGEWKLPE